MQSVDTHPFTHRLACDDDRGALNTLIDASIGALLAPLLTQAQIDGSREIMGLDTQLIEDGTYFVVEIGGRIAGCGGWSWRATPFGCDHSASRDARALDPATEPARIRAMYTHPEFARRGIGRNILSLCEAAAAQDGFRRVELVATVAGERLYAVCGYDVLERGVEIAPSGTEVPIARMGKRIEAAGAASAILRQDAPNYLWKRQSRGARRPPER
ncbi:MAG TPA: GNAT family N-acetyltransferase [Rhizomicrobium sp.]|jgi:GNAT superfamily N-acetyltransferase